MQTECCQLDHREAQLRDHMCVAPAPAKSVSFRSRPLPVTSSSVGARHQGRRHGHVLGRPGRTLRRGRTWQCPPCWASWHDVVGHAMACAFGAAPISQPLNELDVTVIKSIFGDGYRVSEQVEARYRLFDAHNSCSWLDWLERVFVDAAGPEGGGCVREPAAQADPGLGQGPAGGTPSNLRQHFGLHGRRAAQCRLRR